MYHFQRLLSQPDAWNCLDEDEKREILSLLPKGVHPDPDPRHPDGSPATIVPLPESFLRFSNHWRNGVRQFQEDLGNGYYDPEWQQQAEKASRERANGRFDRFKEEEFEQFWGQKQRVNAYANPNTTTLPSTGEGPRGMLASLVQEGIVQVGDVWKYARTLIEAKSDALVDMNAKVCTVSFFGFVLGYLCLF